MKFIRTHRLTSEQKLAVLELWNAEYPEKLKYNSLSDFEDYLNGIVEKNHLLLVDDRQLVQAWFVSFQRANQHWFAMILKGSLQGKGWGTQLLNHGKQGSKELNGWVIDHNNDVKSNGEIYSSPLHFYLKNGFQVISSERLELEQLSAVKIKWVP